LHNAVQRFFIADGRSGCERRRLSRELVENAGIVRCHAEDFKF
jgi:hypothetical protein